MARIVQQMEDVRAGRARLKGKLTLTTTALKERRFRWGSALPSALAAMLAKNDARSLLTGEVIGTHEYLNSESGANFVALADEDQVNAALGKEVIGGKSVANTIVGATSDASQLKSMAAEDHTREQSRLEQTIEAERVKLLQANALQRCLYEVLLYADGEDAVTYAEAAHVVANLIDDCVARLDSVRLRPQIEELKHGHVRQHTGAPGIVG